MSDEIINYLLHIQQSRWQTSQGNCISGILVFYRSLRHVKQPLFVKCVFRYPSDVTSLQLLFFTDKTHGLYADRGQVTCKE